MTEYRVRDVFGAAHAAHRAARAHRHVPEPGQPSRTAQLLPARSDVPRPRRVVVGDGGRHGRHPPGGDRRVAVDRVAPARLAGRRRRRRAARPRRARLRAAAADPAVEPLPPAARMDARAAGDVGRALRRPRHVRGPRRRRLVLRPDPRALSRPRRRHGRARRGRRGVARPAGERGRSAGDRRAAWRGVSASVWCCGCHPSPTSSPRSRATSASSSTTSARRRRPRSGSPRASGSPCTTSTSGVAWSTSSPAPDASSMRRSAWRGGRHARGVGRRRGRGLARRPICTAVTARRGRRRARCSARCRWPASSAGRGTT